MSANVGRALTSVIAISYEPVPSAGVKADPLGYKARRDETRWRSRRLPGACAAGTRRQGSAACRQL